MPKIATNTYATLRKNIAHLLTEGRERAEQAVERERVRTYNEIGKLIHEHLLSAQTRADYGDQLITRLSQDLNIGKTQLYEARAFYQSAPIFLTSGKLGWSHYVELLKLTDPERQKQLAQAAAQHNWSVRELRAQIHSAAIDIPTPTDTPLQPSSPLTALRGHLFTYHLVPSRTTDDLRLDLGFGIHLSHPLTDLNNPQPGDRVTVTKNRSVYTHHPAEGRKTAYYSFTGRVDHIIDGDTVWLDIDCGFGVWSRQKLRLRGIDTPEMNTNGGIIARRFVQDRLQNLPFVTVTTTKPDKFDRFLADVFYLPNTSDPHIVLQQGHYLNRDLVTAGLAQRFRE